MKVILLENLRKIGSIGEIIDVKRGFARNFLISSKKALYASKENIAEVNKIKTELGKKDTEKKNQAQKILEKINGKEYKIEKLSTENKELYGSVKPTEISKLIQENDKIEIKPSMIQPINEVCFSSCFVVLMSSLFFLYFFFASTSLSTNSIIAIGALSPYLYPAFIILV